MLGRLCIMHVANVQCVVNKQSAVRMHTRTYVASVRVSHASKNLIALRISSKEMRITFQSVLSTIAPFEVKYIYIYICRGKLNELKINKSWLLVKILK